MGIDPGIRGGAGLAFITEGDGAFLQSEKVVRDPGHSTIQMMIAVRQRIKAYLHDDAWNIVAVAREDHVFPQQIERIARNILRRLNGVIDVTICNPDDFCGGHKIEGETYLGFPVGSWKVLAGLPGDLGKETREAEKGTTVRLGTRKKKGTPEQYLVRINELLGHEHKSVDEADAHAIAKAARIVRLARSEKGFFLSQPERVQEALWDKEKCGATVKSAIKKNPAIFFDDLVWLRKWLKDYAL